MCFYCKGVLPHDSTPPSTPSQTLLWSHILHYPTKPRLITHVLLLLLWTLLYVTTAPLRPRTRSATSSWALLASSWWWALSTSWQALNMHRRSCCGEWPGHTMHDEAAGHACRACHSLQTSLANCMAPTTHPSQLGLCDGCTVLWPKTVVHAD